MMNRSRVRKSHSEARERIRAKFGCLKNLATFECNPVYGLWMSLKVREMVSFFLLTCLIKDISRMEFKKKVISMVVVLLQLFYLTINKMFLT